MGVPSGARMPPCVLRIKNSLRPSSEGFQPIPASCVQPKMSPLGRVRRVSSVSGRKPGGPGAVERIWSREESPESKISFMLVYSHAL